MFALFATFSLYYPVDHHSCHQPSPNPNWNHAPLPPRNIKSIINEKYCRSIFSRWRWNVAIVCLIKLEIILGYKPSEKLSPHQTSHLTWKGIKRKIYLTLKSSSTTTAAAPMQYSLSLVEASSIIQFSELQCKCSERALNFPNWVFAGYVTWKSFHAVWCTVCPQRRFFSGGKFQTFFERLPAASRDLHFNTFQTFSAFSRWVW